MNIAFDGEKKKIYTKLLLILIYPENIYLFKINNRNIRKRYEICPKLAVKKTERSCAGVFIVNSKHSPLFLGLQCLTLNS